MAFKRTIRDLMSETVVVTTEDMIITDVIKLLLCWHISGLPVVDDEGKLLGIITEHDIMNLAFSGYAADTRVREVMITDVVTHSPDTLVEDAINSFATSQIRRVPVVENQKVVGMISRRDIIREMNRTYSQLVAKDDTESFDRINYKWMPVSKTRSDAAHATP